MTTQGMMKEKAQQQRVFMTDELKALPTLLYGKGVSQATICQILGRASTGGMNGIINRFIDKYSTEQDKAATSWTPQQRATNAVARFLEKQKAEVLAANMELPQKLFFKQSDLAAYLGVSPSTITNWHTNGELPKPRKLGALKLWARADIEAWIADAGKEDSDESVQAG